MCCCGKPTINGEPGYSWDGKRFGVRPPNPPELQEGDVLLYDEPGRCGGGTDSHCHHFRLVKNHFGFVYLLVRHGGGDERISLGSTRNGLKTLVALDSGERYWMLQMLYHVQADAARAARQKECEKWSNAAAEKRIKTRRLKDRVRVTIED